MSGRWRAITSSYIRDEVPRPDTTAIFSMIAVLLFLCGWSWQSKESQGAVPKMRNKITAIQEQCKQLKAAMKEGITTSDLDVFCVVPGSVFGPGMVDAYADATASTTGVTQTDEGLVLCTVGMGLRKSFAKRDNELEVRYQVDMLLEPRVALTSVLTDNIDDDVVMGESLEEQTRLDGSDDR